LNFPINPPHFQLVRLVTFLGSSRSSLTFLSVSL
jgi:hypothetical protein